MKRNALILLLGLVVVGCASPSIRRVGLKDDRAGVRVRQHSAYEVIVYSVDEKGVLVLRQWRVESLPHPSAVYAVDYTGAFVSSSKLKVSLHETGALSSVRVETTRTLKEAAEAGGSVVDQVVKARTAEAEARDRAARQQDVVDRLKAIKNFREAYDAATSLPAAPGEPALLDGSSVPGK